MEASPRQPEPIDSNESQQIQTPLEQVARPQFPRLQELLRSPRPHGVIDPKPQQARLPRDRFGDRGMNPQGRLES